jgi:hypothetical protein
MPKQTGNDNIDELLSKDNKSFDEICKGYKYTPPIIGRRPRIVAIGDLHGDLNLAKACLKLAKCIDDNNKWIGGNTYIVQVGDQIDSCRPVFKQCNDGTTSDEPNDVHLLEFFTKLDKKAIKDGGRVISLLGNHELMNVLGDMRYVSAKSLNNETFKNEQDRVEKFKPGHEWAKYLGCTRLSSVIIGDFIFVHAGFIPGFMSDAEISSPADLIKLNTKIRRWLLGIIENNLHDNEYIKTIINGNETSMFWDRILGTLPPNVNMNHVTCKNFLENSLNIFGVKSMVIGHTPQFQNKLGVHLTCQDVEYPMHGLYRIDFGGSYAFDMLDNEFRTNGQKMKQRTPQVLEIIYKNPQNLNDVPIVNILGDLK